MLRGWLLENAVGFDLGAIDWHFISDITIQGYCIGMRLSSAFGRVYNLDITGCRTCLEVESVVPYGGQLTCAVLRADGGSDPVALHIRGAREENGFSCHAVTLESTGRYAVVMEDKAYLTLQDSSVKAGGPAYIIKKGGSRRAVRCLPVRTARRISARPPAAVG